MSERVRIPAKRVGAFVAADDVIASSYSDPSRYASRFSLTVADEALAQMGPEVVRFVAQRMADQIQHEHYDTVQRLVHEFLMDRQWAEPVIKEAISHAVRDFIRDMFEYGDRAQKEAGKI